MLKGDVYQVGTAQKMTTDHSLVSYSLFSSNCLARNIVGF